MLGADDNASTPLGWTEGARLPSVCRSCVGEVGHRGPPAFEVMAAVVEAACIPTSMFGPDGLKLFFCSKLDILCRLRRAVAWVYGFRWGLPSFPWRCRYFTHVDHEACYRDCWTACSGRCGFCLSLRPHLQVGATFLFFKGRWPKIPLKRNMSFHPFLGSEYVGVTLLAFGR